MNCPDCGREFDREHVLVDHMQDHGRDVRRAMNILAEARATGSDADLGNLDAVVSADAPYKPGSEALVAFVARLDAEAAAEEAQAEAEAPVDDAEVEPTDATPPPVPVEAAAPVGESPAPAGEMIVDPTPAE